MSVADGSYTAVTETGKKIEATTLILSASPVNLFNFKSA